MAVNTAGTETGNSKKLFFISSFFIGFGNLLTFQSNIRHLGYKYIINPVKYF